MLLRRGNAGALKERVEKLASRKGAGEHLSPPRIRPAVRRRQRRPRRSQKFAAAHGLAVVQEHRRATHRGAFRHSGAVQRSVRRGSAAFEHPGGSYRGRVGSVHLPDELKGVVEAVLGLDNRPAAKPHFRAAASPGNVHWHADAGGDTSFTPPQIASLYDFRRDDGQGQCVGIIELGGGERAADLNAYFSGLGIAPRPRSPRSRWTTARTSRPATRTGRTGR